jgi:hypothetical protein
MRTRQQLGQPATARRHALRLTWRHLVTMAAVLLGLGAGSVPMAAASARVASAAPGSASPAGPGAAAFVTRAGSQLTLNGQPFRFAGANIYWLGLDENGRTTVTYPTQFRVRSALATAAEMGDTVVRAQTLGMSVGNPLSIEPSLGVFNKKALDVDDYAIYMAQKYGIRLQIPLVDNWNYYLGAYHTFTDWLGVSGTSCPSSACATTFYTDPAVIAAFEKYISVILNHVNIYTGVPNKDNPAIMTWETGNELGQSPSTVASSVFSTWTDEISRFIKSIAPRQLVMDGYAGVNPADLSLPDVDIYTHHYYPANASAVTADATAATAAGKVFVAGEYGWTSSSRLVPFLSAVQSDPEVSGDIYWSLFPQNDGFGYTQHYDGYQLHFPGDNADVGSNPPVLAATSDAALVTDLREHAYAMSGLSVPAYPVPAAPEVTNVEHVNGSYVGTGNLVEWQGSAGAASYTVQRSTAGPRGPWQTVCTTCTDSSTPWLDADAPDGPHVWYQVTAVNPDGVAGRPSAAYQLSLQTFVDPLNSFDLTYSHSPDLTLDTTSPQLFRDPDLVSAGDASRAASPTGSTAENIVWKEPEAASFEATAYYAPSSADTPSTDVVQTPSGLVSVEGVAMPTVLHFSFLLSADGRHWTAVPAGDVYLNWGAAPARGDWTPYIYTIDNIQQILRGAAYVKAQWGSGGADTAELGEVRITHGHS